MAQSDLPPVPFKAPMTDEGGRPTSVWSEWFRKLSGSSVRAASGYLKLPGGIMIQWGVATSVASGSVTAVSFPTAFPSTCFLVIAGFRDNSGSATTETGTCGTGGYTVSGFDLYNRTSNTHSFNWIAIGH